MIQHFVEVYSSDFRIALFKESLCDGIDTITQLKAGVEVIFRIPGNDREVTRDFFRVKSDSLVSGKSANDAVDAAILPLRERAAHLGADILRYQPILQFWDEAAWTRDHLAHARACKQSRRCLSKIHLQDRPLSPFRIYLRHSKAQTRHDLNVSAFGYDRVDLNLDGE